MVHQIVVLVTPEEFSPVIHSSSRWTWTPTVWNISQSTFNYSILTRHYILIYQLFNRGDILFLKTQILLRTNLKKDYRKITTQIIFTSAGEVFVFVVCQQDFTKKQQLQNRFQRTALLQRTRLPNGRQQLESRNWIFYACGHFEMFLWRPKHFFA